MKYEIVTSLMILLSATDIVYAKNTVMASLEDITFKQENNFNKAYDKNGELFSGVVVIPDENGRKIAYTYKEGIRSGVAVARFEDGSLDIEITYKQGLKNGEEIQFGLNGKPKYKKTYKNDILHGEEITFYENGKPQRKVNYVDGILEGEANYYDENANLIRIENYKNGIKNGVERIIENNILKQENIYVNGNLDGISKKYDEKYLVEEINFKNGVRSGIYRKYSSDGGIIEIPYVKDKKSGVGYAYYPDKKIANKAVYLNDEKNGLSERYYKNGVVQLSQNYKNGKREGVSRMFDNNGKLLKVSYYVNDIELAVVDINNNPKIKELYQASQKKQLGKYLSQRNNWYPILWLAISTADAEILNELEKSVKMYNAKINETATYAKASKSLYNTYNKQLFFGMTPLGYAVNLTSPTEILQKFSSKNDIEEVSPRGDTPLSDAVRLNNLEMVRFLLIHDADVKKIYANGNTILLYALKEKVRPEIVEELIKAGADIKHKNTYGNSALSMAIEDNNEQITKMLLNADAETPQNIAKMMFYALEVNAEDEIYDVLLQAGADVNYKNSQGELLLLKMLQSKKYEIAEKILQSGADVNLQNANGESVALWALFNLENNNLLKAIYSKNPDYINNKNKYNTSLWKLLAHQNKLELLENALKQMGGILQKDINGDIPFMYLLHLNNDENLQNLIFSVVKAEDLNNNPEIIWEIVKDKKISYFKQLVAKKINPDIVNEQGVSLLQYLIINNYPLKYIEELEQLPLNINSLNKSKETALVLAVKNSDIEVVKNLLEHGADANITPDDSNIMIFVNGEDSEITELLLSHGADLKYATIDNKTVMMYGVEILNETLLKYLSDNNFDVNFPDIDGNTAIMYIAEAIVKNAEMPKEKLLGKISTIIDILIAKGGNINHQNSNGETVLVRIAKLKLPISEKVLEILQEKGANMNLHDQYGKTAQEYL